MQSVAMSSSSSPSLARSAGRSFARGAKRQDRRQVLSQKRQRGLVATSACDQGRMDTKSVVLTNKLLVNIWRYGKGREDNQLRLPLIGCWHFEQSARVRPGAWRPALVQRLGQLRRA